MILFFDLPSVKDSEKADYRHFVSFLKKEGFFMLQESVYTKLALTPYVSSATETDIRKNLPKNGIISILIVTEKQYGEMKTLLGKTDSEVLDTTERLVEI